MIRLLLITLSVLCVESAFGQKSFGIKIYQNTDIFDIEYYGNRNSPPTAVDIVNFNRISFAANIQTKKAFIHEVELIIPEISKSLDKIQYPINYEFRKGDTFDGEISSYSLRYEVSRTLTNEIKRFALGIGTGINPYYILIEYIPNVESTYYASTKLFGFAVNLTPRISYNFTNQLSVDLSVPLKIYDLRSEKVHFDNPAIPIRQQTVTDVHNIFFERAYTIRLGVMFRLAK